VCRRRFGACKGRSGWVVTHPLCRASLHRQKPPAFSTYKKVERRWKPVKFPFEKLSLPNQTRAHSLMTQHCCRELTGGLWLCSMERITYKSQMTERSC